MGEKEMMEPCAPKRDALGARPRCLRHHHHYHRSHRRVTCSAHHRAQSTSTEKETFIARRSFAGFAGALLGLAIASPEKAVALGPENVPLDIIDYKTVECVGGVRKGARCV